MKKKILSLLLALCFVMALVPMTAFAEGTSVDNWDGTADTSWYTDHKTDTEYHFTTAEQLAGLAQLVNDKTASVSFEGKTIYLDNDLDLSGSQWTPIGDGSNHVRFFAGTFNGQHHKIMNLNHHYTGNEVVRNGLFGVVSDGGTLKNLLVIDADIDSNDGSLIAGILADWVNGGTVENCYTSGKIENNVGSKFVGGLIGQCTWSTQVKGCGSDAKVISTESNEDDVDTVGGLIGQWENSADSSSITDCWFGGSVSCNNIYSAVGGILGANFENFSGNKPGVIIKNCIVATKNITCAEPGNITWITAVVKTHVTDCIWPDTPPDGVTLDEEKYPDNKGNYFAVAKLVVDWDAGTASADSTFDQSSCGTPVSNFTSADVLTGLRTNAGTGIEWVAGINHPTFAWDVWHIPADYTKFIGAIAAFLKEVETSPFSDVSTSAYYYEAVKWAQKKGITGGIGNGLFGPNQPCTRAQIVTFLWRAAGSPVVNYAMNMSDVPESSYYAEAVRWALSEGITNGTGDGKFSPNATCTRAQSVTFLYRAIGKLVDSKAEFSDVLADSYYANAVDWAVENGVTNGIGDGLFGPDNSCTRAQIVTFLFRAYQGK